MSIHAIDKNMRIRNVVIDYRDRPENSVSKLNTYSDGFKVLRTIMRLFATYTAAGLLRAAFRGAVSAGADIFYSGHGDLYPYRTGSELSDTDCLRFRGYGSDSIFLCGTDFKDDFQKEPSRL